MVPVFGWSPTRVTAAVLTTALLATASAAAERLNDKDVKQLIERIDNERDRFEDQLDGKLKRSIIRGPGGEVDVERFLDDLQENVDKLEDRFSSQYAASAEVTTVLRQGSDIQRYMSTLPPSFDGASEWNRLAASLAELAAAYGSGFPVAEGQQARRLNDGEVKKAAEEIGKNADRFKKDLDSALKQDTSVAQAAREAAVKEADGLKQDARHLASTIGGGKPSSGEAQALIRRASAIRAAGSGRPMSGAAQSSWNAVEEGLAKIAQAYDLPLRLP